MEQEKNELLATIKQNYTGAHEMNIENSVAFTANIRATLEAAAKLFWKEKLGYIPSWTRGSKEIFITGQAVRSQKFTAFFERWALKEMEYICDACGDSVHGENMSIDTANELISSLDKSLRAMEKILGFLIIPAIRKEEIKNNTAPQKPIETTPVDLPTTNPLLNKTVKHWIYGEGKIIKIVGDRMTVQFAKKQEEYGQESLKNGFLKLVDTQKPKIAPSTPRTYAPNIPEIKQVIKPTSVITDCNESPIKSISKFDAIRLFKNSGLNILSRNCTFATKNSMSYLYWANPKTDLLEDDWWLILNDNINYKIHIFKISANSLDVDMIKVRADKPYLIDLQILFDDDRFTDTRSNIQFAKWYIKTLTY